MRISVPVYRTALFLALLTALLTETAFSRQSPQQSPREGPWIFAVLADPQMGMYADNRNFEQETANFEFVVANLNRLRPSFVVICGDLVNRGGDTAQIAEYKRILRELDPSIHVYNVAGNHDVGNVPTAATLGAYRGAFGPDYYTFSAPGMLGVVLDSNLIRSPEGDPEAAQEQKAWLLTTLSEAKADSARKIVVFQHIPYFDRQPDEPVNYFNIPEPARRTYLDLLEKAGVGYVFAGHWHRPALAADGPLAETVTGAVGRPLGHSASGFRIVRVDGQKLESQWYSLGRIPNTIDPQLPLPDTSPQPSH